MGIVRIDFLEVWLGNISQLFLTKNLIWRKTQTNEKSSYHFRMFLKQFQMFEFMSFVFFFCLLFQMFQSQLFLTKNLIQRKTQTNEKSTHHFRICFEIVLDVYVLFYMIFLSFVFNAFQIVLKWFFIKTYVLHLMLLN